MDDYENESPILGYVSIVSAIIGFVGQGCCCVPIISMIAPMVVSLAILISIVTGGIGVMQLHGTNKTLSMVGLVGGILDVIVLVGFMGSLIFLYGGLVVLGNM